MNRIKWPLIIGLTAGIKGTYLGWESSGFWSTVQKLLMHFALESHWTKFLNIFEIGDLSAGLPGS